MCGGYRFLYGDSQTDYMKCVKATDVYDSQADHVKCWPFLTQRHGVSVAHGELKRSMTIFILNIGTSFATYLSVRCVCVAVESSHGKWSATSAI